MGWGGVGELQSGTPQGYSRWTLMTSPSLEPDMSTPEGPVALICFPSLVCQGFNVLIKNKGQESAEQRTEEMKALWGKATQTNWKGGGNTSINERGEERLRESEQKKPVSVAPGPAECWFVFYRKRCVIFPPLLANNDKEEWLQSLLKWNTIVCGGVPSEWNVLSDISYHVPHQLVFISNCLRQVP